MTEPKKTTGLPIPGGIPTSAPAKSAGLPIPTSFPEGAEPLKRRHHDPRNVVEIVTPPLAYWFDRALGGLIDIALFFTPLVISILIAASASPDAKLSSIVITILFGFMGSLGVFFGQAWLEGNLGQALGKMVLGLVVINKTNSETIGFRKALTRSFVKLVLDIAPAGTGLLSIYRDERWSQSRSDQATGTIVVYHVRRAPLSYEEVK